VKHTVPTLTALAAFAVIGTPAFGASFADDLVIKPAAQLQLRAQLGASGTGNDGNDNNIYNGVGGGAGDASNDVARFSIRRARFGVSAKNTTGWDAMFQIRAGERNDAGTVTTVTSSTTTGIGNATLPSGPSSNQPVTLYYANIGKVIKTDSLEHRIHGGLDKPFNGESSISSTTYMFPTDRAVANLIEYRSVGIGYTMKHELFKFGFDIADGGNWSNFSAKGTDTGTAAGSVGGIAAPSSQGNTVSSESKPGLFYSARIEFAPGAEYMPTKKMESFAGAEGTHLVIGFDIQNDNKDLTASANNGAANATNTAQTTTIFGPDVVFHLDGLSAVADYRQVTVSQSLQGAGTAADDVHGNVFDILAGYAIPTDSGLVVEPAIKYGKTDLNKDQDEGAISKYSNGEWKAGSVSGSEITLGLNLYWNGNANKTQFAYSMWKGEASAAAAPQDGTPKANVFTIQQQVTF
jgi:hypothetical protein